MTILFWLGSAPCEEQPTSIKHPDYKTRGSIECLVYMRMLQRLFPELSSATLTLSVQASQHDFGTYLEVVAQAPHQDAAAISLGERIEATIPENWDQDASFELHWFGSHQALIAELLGSCEEGSAQALAILEKVQPHHMEAQLLSPGQLFLIP